MNNTTFPFDFLDPEPQPAPWAAPLAASVVVTRHNEPWTRADKELAVFMAANGLDLNTIAAVLGRSPGAVSVAFSNIIGVRYGHLQQMYNRKQEILNR